MIIIMNNYWWYWTDRIFIWYHDLFDCDLIYKLLPSCIVQHKDLKIKGDKKKERISVKDHYQRFSDIPPIDLLTYKHKVLFRKAITKKKKLRMSHNFFSFYPLTIKSVCYSLTFDILLMKRRKKKEKKMP
jgi:hypothetical protein